MRKNGLDQSQFEARVWCNVRSSLSVGVDRCREVLREDQVLR